MTDKPITFWHAASDEPLDKIESALCDGPECSVTQQCRTVFNELHRLRAALEAKDAALKVAVGALDDANVTIGNSVESVFDRTHSLENLQQRIQDAAGQINTILKGEVN